MREELSGNRFTQTGALRTTCLRCSHSARSLRRRLRRHLHRREGRRRDRRPMRDRLVRKPWRRRQAGPLRQLIRLSVLRLTRRCAASASGTGGPAPSGRGPMARSSGFTAPSPTAWPTASAAQNQATTGQTQPSEPPISRLDELPEHHICDLGPQRPNRCAGLSPRRRPFRSQMAPSWRRLSSSFSENCRMSRYTWPLSSPTRGGAFRMVGGDFSMWMGLAGILIVPNDG